MVKYTARKHKLKVLRDLEKGLCKARKDFEICLKEMGFWERLPPLQTLLQKYKFEACKFQKSYGFTYFHEFLLLQDRKYMQLVSKLLGVKICLSKNWIWLILIIFFSELIVKMMKIHDNEEKKDEYSAMESEAKSAIETIKTIVNTTKKSTPQTAED